MDPSHVGSASFVRLGARTRGRFWAPRSEQGSIMMIGFGLGLRLNAIDNIIYTNNACHVNILCVDQYYEYNEDFITVLAHHA